MDTTTAPRPPYPSDVDDEEWALVVPSLTLLDAAAPQRRSPSRELFNGLRWIVRAGAPWRMLPTNLPPWHAVYEQTQRWIAAGCFERLVHDLRVLIRLGEGRAPEPTGVILDSRTMQSTPESGGRAGWDGAKRRKGTKLHMVVDTLGQLLALHVTAADEQDRDQVGELVQQVQAITGDHVTLAYVDAAYTGQEPAQAAADAGISLEVVSLPEAKRGFVLLPRRWVMERSFGWMARFRRLARDYERLPTTVAGLPFVAFACLMLHRVIPLLGQSPTT
jgi:transposase